MAKKLLKLVNWLHENKIQHKDFAKTIGITEASMSNLINCKSEARRKLREKISKETGIPVADLLIPAVDNC